MASGGDWLVLYELLERGDPEFVNRLRAIDDAEALGRFAERWYHDSSPNARRLLLAYLERPLNAFRHEALIKRLFKHAETASDDAVMARFLAAFDRSVRHMIRKKRHRVSVTVNTWDEAAALVSRWKQEGYDWANHWDRGGQGPGRYHAMGSWSEPVLTTPGGTTMPRGSMVEYKVGYDLVKRRYETILAPDWVKRLRLDPKQFQIASLPPESSRQKLEMFRLFSLRTRYYLRRRASALFRKLGKGFSPLQSASPEDPGDGFGRYIAAISGALVLYEDADVSSGMALIDNWGLMHALFHDSPVLEARSAGLASGGGSLALGAGAGPDLRGILAIEPREPSTIWSSGHAAARSGSGPFGC